MHCCVICGIPLVRGNQERPGRFARRQTCGLRTECARELNRRRGLERDFPPQPQCYADGCDRQAVAHGVCLKHYKRLWRHGDITRDKHTPKRSRADRFWEKVAKADPNECWLWTGATNERGYGVLHDKDERIAPRISWIIHNGPIPDDLWVLHKCDNPPCVNPAHLFLGTVLDNNADMLAKGRHYTALTADQVLRVRAYLSAGRKGRVVAGNVGEWVISAIKTAKTWRHL